MIHWDINSSNLMLYEKFNAKLGDFGLARLVDRAKGARMTTLAKIVGYMAPGCIQISKASKEPYIYSFWGCPSGDSVQKKSRRFAVVTVPCGVCGQGLGTIWNIKSFGSIKSKTRRRL